MKPKEVKIKQIVLKSYLEKKSCLEMEKRFNLQVHLYSRVNPMVFNFN